MKSAVMRVALVILLIFVSMKLLSPAVFHLETGELSLRLVPAIPGGELKLGLGPFGELTWRTHRGPLNVEAVFIAGDNIDTLPQPEDFGDLPAKFIRAKLVWFLSFGGLMGAVVLSGSPQRRLVGAALSALTVLALALILGLLSIFTFNTQSLKEPRYEGPLRDAPRILRLVSEIQTDWDEAKLNFNEVLVGLQRLHEQVTTGAEVPNPPATKFLVVSDLHNNPLGMVMASELAESFKVDAILDAGDFTDRGTVTEAELFVENSKAGVPYILVAGNHEDRPAIEWVKRAGERNMKVLENDALVEIEGISIIGESDPNGYKDDRDPKLIEKVFPEVCREVEKRFAENNARILLVHNPKIGRCAARYAEEHKLPLVFVSGHEHRQVFERHGTVIYLSAGTSGAGGFTKAVRNPYGFAVVEFEEKTKSFASACLLLFDGPGELRQSSCHF